MAPGDGEDEGCEAKQGGDCSTFTDDVQKSKSALSTDQHEEEDPWQSEYWEVAGGLHDLFRRPQCAGKGGAASLCCGVAGGDAVRQIRREVKFGMDRIQDMLSNHLLEVVDALTQLQAPDSEEADREAPRNRQSQELLGSIFHNGEADPAARASAADVAALVGARENQAAEAADGAAGNAGAQPGSADVLMPQPGCDRPEHRQLGSQRVSSMFLPGCAPGGADRRSAGSQVSFFGEGGTHNGGRRMSLNSFNLGLTVTPSSLTQSWQEEDKRRRSVSQEKFAQRHTEEGAGTNPRTARQFCQWIVSTSAFDLMSAVLILSNLVFAGIQVEYMAKEELLETPLLFVIGSQLYVVLFCIELFMRLVADPKHFYDTSKPWNILDGIVVLVSLMYLLLPLNSVQLGALRAVRATRVMCMLRVTWVFSSLRMLVLSIMSTLRSLMWTMFLLMLIMLSFGTLFTEAATSHLLSRKLGPAVAETSSCREECSRALQHYYSSLGRSMYTLFKCVCGGVTWQEAADPLESIHWAWGLLFLIFISFTYFAVMNVVTGVFCHSAIQSAQFDHQMALQSNLEKKKMHIHTLEAVFAYIDGNSDGEISIWEFEECMDDDTVKAYFATLDLSVEQGWTMFKLLDHDMSETLDQHEFISGCMRLSGLARSMDLASVASNVTWLMNKLTDFICFTDRRFSKIGRISAGIRRDSAGSRRDSS